MSRTFFIKTYGCQMNVYDSGRMADLLGTIGLAPTLVAEEADLVVLNTCHIREKAAEKVYSELGRLRLVKRARRRQGGDMIIAVGGCVAQAEGAEVRRRIPDVDIVFGPQTYHRLADLVSRRWAGGAAAVDTEFPAEIKFDALPVPGRQGASAFLAVQEGCDKFCSFCVVPYTRGAEYSRPVEAVAAEAAALVDAGAREITLLGQNVNAYHGRDGHGRERTFADLLHRLAAIEGLARLRYTSPHPLDMDDGLIAAHATLAALQPFVHLPAQSGSDRVLAAMNRRYDRRRYLDVVTRLRAARPDIALSSDFIVGFPGESETDFAATLDLVNEVGYAQAYSFKYSPRPGTPAAERDDQVPEAVRTERLGRLQDLIARQQAAFNAATVGRRLDVLFDRPGQREGQILGRSPYNQAVVAHAPARLIGALAPVEIVAAHSHSLAGTLATHRSAA